MAEGILRMVKRNPLIFKTRASLFIKARFLIENRKPLIRNSILEVKSFLLTLAFLSRIFADLYYTIKSVNFINENIRL